MLAVTIELISGERINITGVISFVLTQLSGNPTLVLSGKDEDTRYPLSEINILFASAEQQTGE